MNTTAARSQYARQHEIRMALRAEYSQSASNEVAIAKLRHEMGRLPHKHEYLRSVADTGTRECRWCDFGTDAYTLDTATVVAEARESEAAGDAILAAILARKDVPEGDAVAAGPEHTWPPVAQRQPELPF